MFNQEIITKNLPNHIKYIIKKNKDKQERDTSL